MEGERLVNEAERVEVVQMAARRWVALVAAGCSTYRIGKDHRGEPRSILCLCCGLQSFSSGDIVNLHCSFCHHYHGDSVSIGEATDVVRFVEFSAPGEPPTIYWTPGHGSDNVAALFSLSVPVEMNDLRRGWGSRKLSFLGIYLSDSPQPNFEPLTYWIRADNMAAGQDR